MKSMNARSLRGTCVPARVVQVEARERGPPGLEQRHQPAGGDVAPRPAPPNAQRDAHARAHRAPAASSPSLATIGPCTSIPNSRPLCAYSHRYSAAGQAHAGCSGGRAGPPACAARCGRPGSAAPRRWRCVTPAQRHGDHVLRQVLAEPDAGVEAAGHQVEQRVVAMQLDRDVRVRVEEVGQVRQHHDVGRRRDRFRRSSAGGLVARLRPARRWRLASEAAPGCGLARGSAARSRSGRRGASSVPAGARPARVSSVRTVCDSADGDTPSSAAARVKLPWCATRAKAAMAGSRSACIAPIMKRRLQMVHATGHLSSQSVRNVGAPVRMSLSLTPPTLSGHCSMNNLQGKVAIVTGSSKGIGAGIAARLAADGAPVVVNYSRNAAAADKSWSSASRRQAARPSRCRPTSRSSRPDRSRWSTRAVAHFGRLDILVNNAGIYKVDYARHAHRRELRRALPPERARPAADHPGRGARDAGRRRGRQHQLRPGQEPLSDGARVLQHQGRGRHAHAHAGHGAGAARDPRRGHRARLRGHRGQCRVGAGHGRLRWSPRPRSAAPASRPTSPRRCAYAVSDDAGWVTGTTIDVAGGMVF